jgi:repressor LexA
MSTFGQVLRSLRKEKKWTQVELSEKSGISKIQICHLERGKSNPTPRTLSKLVKVFDVDFETLYKTIEK